MHRIQPCLWFDDQAEQAVAFYTSVFPRSKVRSVVRYGDAASKESGRPKGSVMTVEFELDGQPFLALNGGPVFHFTEAVSLIVYGKDQDEVDEYWRRLSEGGEEGQCGWLKDRYGLSWQVVPASLPEMLEEGDAAQIERLMSAIIPMKKLDVAALKRAFSGK